MVMETAFDLLDDSGRKSFLLLLMQSFQCSYVCFWSFRPSPTNCLKCVEVQTQLPSSSSGGLAQRLFYEYQQSTFILRAENDQVPGYAFRNGISYLEFQELDLQGMGSNETQRQFYKEARIKTAIFMGCKSGEIEIGFSNVVTIKTKMEIQSLFLTEEFQTNTQLVTITTDQPQNPHYSSSSSSLRSLSTIDSPEYSSLLFNISNSATTPSTSLQVVPERLSHSTLQQVVHNPNLTLLSSSIMPHQEAMQAFARLRNPQFPNPETEQEAMTKAILAVLTASLPSSYDHSLINTKSSAFESYNDSDASTHHSLLGHKRSVFKRSIRFFQKLNLIRMRNNSNNRQALQIPRPNSTQLHHMMSERKRREKLNDSFHALRSLLPPGTKKDKASLLNTTKEYLASLKSQIDELSRRNKQLEAQIFPSSKLSSNVKEAASNQVAIMDLSSSSSSFDVRIRQVSESSASEDIQVEIVDLQVIQRAPNIPVDHLVLRILEFLRPIENISLMSLEANTNPLTEPSIDIINRLTMRLKVEGGEWDESAFQEAVRRVVAGLAQ